MGSSSGIDSKNEALGFERSEGFGSVFASLPGHWGGRSREETVSGFSPGLPGRRRRGLRPGGSSSLPLPRAPSAARARLVRKGGLLVPVDLGEHGHHVDRRRLRPQLPAQALALHPQRRVPERRDRRRDDGGVVHRLRPRHARPDRTHRRLPRRQLSAESLSGIDNLYGFDGGAGYKFLLGPVHFLRVEGGVGYTHEEDIITADDVSFTTSRNYANAKAGLQYKWQFTKNAAFTNEFSYLVDLDDTANWFIGDKAAITAAISKVFALQASWTLLYRNQPVIGFGHTDTATAVGLVAKFP